MRLSTEATLFMAVPRHRLLRYNGTWLTYEPGGYYREIDEELLRAEVRRAQPDDCITKASAVNNALDEIKSATVVDNHGADVPMWLCDTPDTPRAADLVVCRNGILHPATATLYQHSDELLTFNALPYDYDPNAPLPGRWMLFLSEVFGADRESVDELQKLFGYLLTLDTSQQKVFAIIGPKRSGKGTIARVLRALIGEANCCAPSFNGLGGDFGLQPLIGKQLALIADARLGYRTDKVLVAERLLSISGEDATDVARKRTTSWTGKLNTRLLILSNELPALPDPSGALASRFVAFETPNSFYGREDRHLTDKLLAELPGILNWALEGLRRVQAGEAITTPATARGLIDDIEKLGSPIKHFVADMCTVREGLHVPKDQLWATYRGWHVANGLPGQPLSKEVFGRNLKTAFAGTVRDFRPRSDGDRPMCWSGITLTAPLTNTPAANYGNYMNLQPPFGQGPVKGRSG
ncbi:MAG: phage/plasmid primase, P4 family [Rhodospirillales bacterium]